MTTLRAESDCWVGILTAGRMQPSWIHPVVNVIPSASGSIYPLDQSLAPPL